METTELDKLKQEYAETCERVEYLEQLKNEDNIYGKEEYSPDDMVQALGQKQGLEYWIYGSQYLEASNFIDELYRKYICDKKIPFNTISGHLDYLDRILSSNNICCGGYARAFKQGFAFSDDDDDITCLNCGSKKLDDTKEQENYKEKEQDKITLKQYQKFSHHMDQMWNNNLQDEICQLLEDDLNNPIKLRKIIVNLCQMNKCNYGGGRDFVNSITTACSKSAVI